MLLFSLRKGLGFGCREIIILNGLILVVNVEFAIVILGFFAPFFPTKYFNLDK